MGKKIKGGRRQILQLEEKKPPKASSKTMKSLIHYSDSDEDSKKSNESESSGIAENKDATPLDSQIADFFKEINALSVPDKLSEELNKTASSSKPEINNENARESCSPDAAGNIPASTSKDERPNDVPSKEVSCPWQEICDSSTGYSYYWNVQTNEVTWDCPPEYAAFIQSAHVGTVKSSHTSQNDKSSDSKEKKKKKNDIVVHEGTIIPISYFGNSSSSDDSSDSESVLPNTKPKLENIGVKKDKKIESKSKSSEGEINELIGPSLPPDFQFPLTDSSTIGTDSEITVTTNEVNEHLLVGPSLSSKSLSDTAEKPSQSDLSDYPAELSTPEFSWNNSTMDKEKKCVQLNETTGDESPDSTVKKENSICHNANKVNNTYGFRSVVEYDSFTDDEEEICVANISSSKPNTDENNCGVKSSSQREREDIAESSTSANILVETENEIVTISSKRKAYEALKENTKKEELIKKPKRSDVNIDSLFASHSTYGKYGFGFGWQKQWDEQNDELYTISIQDFKKHKRQSEFKAVSFVKSEDVLDLKALNDEMIDGKDLSPKEPVNINMEYDQFNTSELRILNNEPIKKNILNNEPSEKNIINDASIEKNIINDASIEKNIINDASIEKNTPNNDLTEKHTLNNELVNDELTENCATKDNVKICNDYEVDSSSMARIKHKIDCSILNKKKGINFLSSAEFRSRTLKVDDDLDEIDKALCEALDAKKSAKKISTKPIPENADISHVSKNVLDSKTLTTAIEKSKDTESSDESVIDADAMTDGILEISSELIDKLTFLLSAPSTHASFNGVFFQLQTRFVDWQAGALDSKYFMARLKELELYIQHYETGVISGEWTYQWDRENKRYFFINTRTRHSQWTYPEELCNPEKLSWVQSQAETDPSSASNFVAERDDLQTVSSSSAMHDNSAQEHSTSESKDNSSGTRWNLLASPPPPPPGVDSPPPPPPHTPPPKSPPPPPPDSTEILREPEDMDIENSNDSSSFLFVNDKNMADDIRMQFLSMMEQSSKRSPNSFADCSILSAVSSTSVSGSENLSTVPKIPQPVSHSIDKSDVNNVCWSQPSCSSQVKISCSSSALVSADAPVNSIEKKNSDTHASSSNGVCSSQSDTLLPKTMKQGNASKKEKKKTKIQPGLGLKKKNIPSLVEKWQKIKEEQNREDNSSDDCKSGNSF